MRQSHRVHAGQRLARRLGPAASAGRSDAASRASVASFVAAAAITHLRLDIRIAVLFDLERQLRTAGLDDPSIGHDVHDIRFDMVQKPLIMRDTRNPRPSLRSAFTPSATSFIASTSRPESVSSRMHIFGSSIAICRISLRFFSPPEKPTLTGRLSISASIFRSFAFSRISLRNSVDDISSWPRALRCEFTAVRRKVMLPTPGISTGYWKARNTRLRRVLPAPYRGYLHPHRGSPSVTS